jgi:ATP-dependent helicase HrpA
MGDERIDRDAWDLDRLPPHLRLVFLVVDDDDTVLGQGHDLDRLRARLAGEVRRAIAELGSDLERHGLTDWDLGALPREVEAEHGGQTVKGYPALVDEGESVGIVLLDRPAEQATAMWQGTRRLLRLTVGFSLRSALAALTNEGRLALGLSPYPGVTALLEDAVVCALDELMADAGGPAWDAAGFERLREHVRAEQAVLLADILADVVAVMRAWREVGRRLEDLEQSGGSPAVAAAVADVAAQRDALVYDGFISAVRRHRLRDLERYLGAMAVRLDKVASAPDRDRRNLALVHRVQQRYDRLFDGLGPDDAPSDDVIEIAWLIEELRVSLFAQGLGTPRPVSEKRVLDAIEAARG